MIRVGDYYVETDKLSFIVGKFGIVKDEKSPKYGQEIQRKDSQTYHANLDQVVDKLINLGLMDSLKDSEFKQIAVFMKEIKDKLEELIELAKESGKL